MNESVADGVTLHWHGVDVPNAEDGVAGVTQNAVRSGGLAVFKPWGSFVSARRHTETQEGLLMSGECMR